MVGLWCTVCSVVCLCLLFCVRGCAVSRRYIDVCYCDMFSVVNVYHVPQMTPSHLHTEAQMQPRNTYNHT